MAYTALKRLLFLWCILFVGVAWVKAIAKPGVQSADAKDSFIQKDGQDNTGVKADPAHLEKRGKTSDEKAASFEAWKRVFAKEAKSAGVTPAFVDFIVPRMALLPEVVRLDRNQPEFLADFWFYTDRALTPERIARGREMLKAHRATLDVLAQRYGVPAHYIVAFWGMETNYGTHKGHVDTLNALTTLAFDERRRTFFTRELITFLKIMDREQTLDFKGSWAGAFGHFQFMPTTYMAYAVDGNGDGRIDVIHQLEDAFASAAHYLKTMRWQEHVRWGREVVFQKKADWEKIDLTATYSVAKWEQLGLVPADGSRWAEEDKDILAELRLPMGTKGPAFLTYANFKTIMRWNRSELYAFAIGLLADRISGQADRLYTPRVHQPFSVERVRLIQRYLTEQGYYRGEADGRAGPLTRAAVRAYQRDHSLPPDGHLDEVLLNRLETKNHDNH